MSASPFVDDLPLQTNPTDETRKSKAPYNFVPLPERVVRAVENADQLPPHDRFTQADYPHSGYFDVCLTTETPLYIRAPLRAEQFADPVVSGNDYKRLTKNIADFFHRGEEFGGDKVKRPVIPGSSLRGMIRSLLEIVSYSKITQVLDRALIYRAVGDTTSLGAWYRSQTLGPNKDRLPNLHFDYPSVRLRGGFLCKDKGDWAIRPARCDVETYHESFIHVEKNDIPFQLRGTEFGNIYVAPAPRTTPPRHNPNLTLELALTDRPVQLRVAGSSAPAGMLPAVLVQSAVIGAKHMHCAIYEQGSDDQSAPFPIPSRMWEQYTEDRDLHRGDGRGSRSLCREGDPLFYLVDETEKLVFFGPTMMFRLPYQNTPLDLVPEPLRQPLDIDFGEALFGYVRRSEDFAQAKIPRPQQGDPAWAYAGRVAVSDARLALDQPLEGLFLETFTPPILSTPKPTTFQHYLVQQNQAKDDLSHYDSPTPDANEQPRGERTVLRGTKLYWHRGRPTRDQLEQSVVPPTSTQHTRMKPIATDKKFTFRVRFDNLSAAELGALCWVLHPRGHANRDYRHSLGMGKPFGMGAVKLEAKLSLLNRQVRYERLFVSDGSAWHTGQGETRDLTNPSVRDTLVEPFETRILEDLGVGSQCQGLAQLRRIGNLLKLMEWPGPAPAQVSAWNVQADNNWQPWKDRRVLPPPYAFGPLGSQQSVPKPNDAEVFKWPAENEKKGSGGESDKIQGSQIDLELYMADKRDKQKEVERVRLLKTVETWNEDDLSNALGVIRQANEYIELFRGNERVLLQVIAERHLATLRRWRKYGGKKGKAFNTFIMWCQTYDIRIGDEPICSAE